MTPLFDYKTISKNLKISGEVVGKFEREAVGEFPDDIMLRELHILRALKVYVSSAPGNK